MQLLATLTQLLTLVALSEAKTAWQQRRFESAVPTTPITTFASSKYATKSDALAALQQALGNASIAYPNDLDYGISIARVWTAQRKLYPDAIIFPTTPEQVSIVMQFYSSAHQLWQDGFAIMGGGHGDTGGGQSPSVVVDLESISSTQIVYQGSRNPNDYAVLKIGGGAEAGSVYNALDGTGWAFLGPRAASIGVGGFLLGGGIAFQTPRYGVGCDSLLAVEVVLVNGTIVYANPYNEHSDLFWAATGGGWLGFGVVTHFYVQAYPDPGEVYFGTIAWGEDKVSCEISARRVSLTRFTGRRSLRKGYSLLGEQHRSGRSSGISVLSEGSNQHRRLSPGQGTEIHDSAQCRILWWNKFCQVQPNLRQLLRKRR